MAATQELPRTASQFPLGPYGNAFRRQLGERLKTTPREEGETFYDLVAGDLNILFAEAVDHTALNGPFNVPVLGAVHITSLTGEIADRKKRGKELTLNLKGVVGKKGKESGMSITLANEPSGSGLILAERHVPFPLSKAVDLYVRTKKPDITGLIMSPINDHFIPKEWLVEDIRLGNAEGENVLHTVFRRDPNYLALPQ